MHPSEVNERVTKYMLAVQAHLNTVGHATNADLLRVLHAEYPALSATTIHRITTRMVERGELRLAPATPENAMRFDANLVPHDHFMCMGCGLIKDADISDAIRPLLEKSIGDGCAISGRLVVSGYCKQCAIDKEDA